MAFINSIHKNLLRDYYILDNCANDSEVNISKK